MSEHVRWIEHKGKRILFTNVKGLHDDKIIAAYDKMIDEIKKFKGDKLLVLTDVTETFTTEKNKKKSMEMIDVYKNKGIKTFSALVGISGFKKLITSALTNELHIFKNIQKAKEWLVKQD